MDLILFNEIPIRELSDYDLDMAFGEDENSFTLVCDSRYAPKIGDLIAVENTEYGGIVDEITADTTSPNVLSCKGRTWHGVLASKVIMPPTGQDYKTVSGTVGKVIDSLMKTLDVPFKAEANDQTINYTFERFIDAYSGLQSMLKANGMKLSIRYEAGDVILSASLIDTFSDEIVSDLLDFKLTSTTCSTNHLVCGGKGDLKDRIVVHLYADENGEVSQTKTFSGLQEVTAFYDHNNADEETLIEDGTKKLKKLFTNGSIDVDVYNNFEASIGDIVDAKNYQMGIEVSAEIVKKILKVEDGEPKVSYEIGTPTTSKINFS